MVRHRPRVFSGVQPTGELHIGNYLGAIRRFVDLQDGFETLYCIVDLHAITQPHDPSRLRSAIREVAAAYFASGIDPRVSIVFNQSRVGQHCELAWIFNCVARIGWLNRQTQYKDKAGKNREKASVGLYVYPTLMAADILAYHATHVPTGDDQKQHLELTRDIAAKFNHDFPDPDGGEAGFFPIPEPLLSGTTSRVMSLRDGRAKMSKSDASAASRIGLLDSNDEIARKIRTARTDSLPMPAPGEDLSDRAEVNNLLGIYCAFSGEDMDGLMTRFSGKDFARFKQSLSDLVIASLAPIRSEMVRHLGDPAELDAQLASGAARAKAIAQPIVERCKGLLGLVG